MKHEENVTYELIPDENREDVWNVRILEGIYNETVINFGAISFNENAQGVMTFNFHIIESPDPDLTVDDEDLQEFAGDVLQEIISDAIKKDNGTIGFREMNESKSRTNNSSEYSD
tara:strand:+ start:671 stop:1015 length:345 start_codon:yes stop_codon:yes gene_type:complete